MIVYIYLFAAWTIIWVHAHDLGKEDFSLCADMTGNFKPSLRNPAIKITVISAYYLLKSN